MAPAQVTGVIATQRRPRPRMRGTYTRTEGCGTCSLLTNWARTSCTGTSSRARPGPVPGVLPLPALPLPARGPHRDHLRQLQPAPGPPPGTAGSAPGPPRLNRIEAQFTALRYFAVNGTDHASHEEQASMIGRYIIWRNNHVYDERLRQIVNRANVA